jgi:beta-lactamase superfamily II metal-dependent hydrolase
MQIPHHGSRRNVSTEILDRWLGPRLGSNPGMGSFDAIVSSAKADTHHPRKAVIRAFMHRGATVYQTEGVSLCSYGGYSPARSWSPATPAAYPNDQED